MKGTILKELQEAEKVLVSFMEDESSIEAIQKAASLMIESIEKGNKILSCGNGGSACDAAHFAEEMTGFFREDRKSLPAIPITDVGHITCTANDIGYEYVYSRYLKGIGRKGDCLLALSTSGNSKNILRAAESAKQMGINVIALTGKNGGELAELSDVEIRVPHNKYSDRIQEIHMKVIHILIQLIEEGISN